MPRTLMSDMGLGQQRERRRAERRQRQHERQNPGKRYVVVGQVFDGWRRWSLHWSRRALLRRSQPNPADQLALVGHVRIRVGDDLLADPVIRVVAAEYLLANLD